MEFDYLLAAFWATVLLIIVLPPAIMEGKRNV